MSGALIAICGLVAGSFLSVCVYRLPRGLSLAHPGSHCPACGHALAAWDNVPLLSYVLLRGRCRACRAAIGWREPLLEAATAAAFYASWRLTGGGLAFVREAFFLGCLLALAVADGETRQLPDEITLGGWATGIALAASGPGFAPALWASFGGAGLAAAVGLGYQRWRGREGLGWGDVKMIGLLGAFLGVSAGLVGLFLGAVAGAAAGAAQALLVFAQRRRRGASWRRARQSTAVFLARGAIPFGVFLAAGGAAALFWGAALWRGWLRLPG
jgi:leader peptidase (prepilin peptidase)/N-methyltransferase